MPMPTSDPMAAFDVARVHADYERHHGDRAPLFEALCRHIEPESVLYPGSHIDIAPSVAFDHVTYVDSDKKANRFFSDTGAVEELIRSKRDGSSDSFEVDFIHADYREPLDIADGSVDLLVSLYAGFVAEHCGRYLASGGWLLVNNSHGDAGVVSLTAGYELIAVVDSRAGTYQVSTSRLDDHLVPKRGGEPTIESLHASGRGIAYTRSPFAYLFEKQ